MSNYVGYSDFLRTLLWKKTFLGVSTTTYVLIKSTETEYLKKKLYVMCNYHHIV